MKKHAKYKSREVSLVTAAYFEYHVLKAIARLYHSSHHRTLTAIARP